MWMCVRVELGAAGFRGWDRLAQGLQGLGRLAGGGGVDRTRRGGSRMSPLYTALTP